MHSSGTKHRLPVITVDIPGISGFVSLRLGLNM